MGLGEDVLCLNASVPDRVPDAGAQADPPEPVLLARCGILDPRVAPR